jgi:hypothetical protein
MTVVVAPPDVWPGIIPGRGIKRCIYEKTPRENDHGGKTKM